MWRVLIVVALLKMGEAAPGCKNCVSLSKAERAMFLKHSDSCMPQSGVTPESVTAMLRGELRDEPALRKHVYCVLLACKLVGKDGKLQKAALLGNLAKNGNATKVLEECSQQVGESPEDLTWNVFRCGYNKKVVLFDLMPAAVPAESEIEAIAEMEALDVPDH